MSSSSTAISSLNITSQQILPLHSSQPTDNVSRNSTLFVRRLTLSVLSLLAIIGLINFILWRILHPLPPVLQVDSFNVSSDTPNHPQLINTGHYDIRFAIRNPNRKLSLLIHQFEIFVYHGKSTVSKEWMQLDMSLKKMIKETSKSTVPSYLPHLRGKMHSTKNIEFEWSKGEVKFDVKVKFGVKYLSWSWLSKRADIESTCGDLSVRFLPAKGKWELVNAGNRECSAHFL